MACKSLLLHVTWAREAASSACFWIAIDNLGRNVPLLQSKPSAYVLEQLLAAPSGSLVRPIVNMQETFGRYLSNGFKHALALGLFYKATSGPLQPQYHAFALLLHFGRLQIVQDDGNHHFSHALYSLSLSLSFFFWLCSDVIPKLLS